MARRSLPQGTVPRRIGNGRKDGTQEANANYENGMDQ
jgi:hypothetical protein